MAGWGRGVGSSCGERARLWGIPENKNTKRTVKATKLFSIISAERSFCQSAIQIKTRQVVLSNQDN